MRTLQSPAQDCVSNRAAGKIADEHRRSQVCELNEIAVLEGLSMKRENRVGLDVARQNLMRMSSTI